MNYVKWALASVFALAVFGILDYALPSRQTVRITNVYNQMIEVGANSIFYASSDSGTRPVGDGRRDVRFIAAVRPNGKPYVYRNEDTGWIWPPYFKYDSSNLHAQASDLVSTSVAPKWVNVTSYGWRIAWLSAYPNAISMRPVAGPEVRPLNWPAMVICAAILAFLVLIWRMWAQFRQRTLDPAMERVEAGGTRARGWMARRWQGRDGR